MQSLGAEIAPRERDGLFEIVSRGIRDARPHPEERACAIVPAIRTRVRVSKEEDESIDAASCFETPRSSREGGALCDLARAARLLSMRALAERRTNLWV
jgi:hypothetical protein